MKMNPKMIAAGILTGMTGGAAAPLMGAAASSAMGGSKEEEGGMNGYSKGGMVGDGKLVAAEEIMAAIKSGNPAALIDPLKSFIELCYGEEDEEASGKVVVIE